MIDQLAVALGQELGLTSKEIADTVWLALQMESSDRSSTAARKASSGEIDTKSNRGQSLNPGALTSDLGLDSEPEKPSQEAKRAEPVAELHTPNSQSENGYGLGSELMLKVPDARSLREPLSLAKSLKPLLQKVTAGWSTELDEAATVERIADEGIWMPVLKPTLEPWLDLALVVDESASMYLWQRTLTELQRLLANYGVFRDVRVWSLVTDDKGQVKLRPRLGAAACRQTLHRPSELVDASGRRLILIATDCVSAIWQNGTVLPTLKLWTASGPMAIIQMLPEWLWARTGLGFASAVRLQALTPGVPNQQLDVRDLSPWDEVDLEAGVRVPVVTLEPEPFLAWTKMVSSKEGAWSPGFIFEPDSVTSIDIVQLWNVSLEDSADQRVQQFRTTASPMARRLAGLLAASPVISLPVVRIIRDRLLPQSKQVHVAEVFLGGLLEQVTEAYSDTKPNNIQFEFFKGTRDLFLESVPESEIIDVINEVSAFIAENIGLTLEEFAAVLRNPEVTQDSDLLEQTRPFAKITAGILERLGGEYARFAQQMERMTVAQAPPPLPLSTKKQRPPIYEDRSNYEVISSGQPYLLELYLTPLDSEHFRIIVSQAINGVDGDADSRLPFWEDDKDWRTTIIKTLESTRFIPENFPEPGEQDWMIRNGILTSDGQSFHPSYLETIGKALYEALLPPGSSLRNAFTAALRTAERDNKDLHLRLKFPGDSVSRSRLADYPWELIHNKFRFLQHQSVQISRYIAHEMACPIRLLQEHEQIQVLLISSRAADIARGLHPLPDNEERSILTGIAKAQENGLITFEQLRHPTRKRLSRHLTECTSVPQILHFDGHGLFGRKCNNPECRHMNPGIKIENCERCGHQLPEPKGYLLFEDEDGGVDYFSASSFAALLPRGVELVVLSACQSGMALGGASIFNGTAQQLIDSRIPAVVAMQYSILANAASNFGEQFYRVLGQKKTLLEAISAGRKWMEIDGNQWYRPVLYLRWQDNYGGSLFAYESPTTALKSHQNQTGIEPPFMRGKRASSARNWWQKLTDRVFKNSSLDQSELNLSPQERLALIRKLNELPSAQFDELVFSLNPPDSLFHQNSQVNHNRIMVLLKWLENDSNSPGIRMLLELLKLIENDFS